MCFFLLHVHSLHCFLTPCPLSSLFSHFMSTLFIVFSLHVHFLHCFLTPCPHYSLFSHSMSTLFVFSLTPCPRSSFLLTPCPVSSFLLTPCPLFVFSLHVISLHSLSHSMSTLFVFPHSMTDFFVFSHSMSTLFFVFSPNDHSLSFSSLHVHSPFISAVLVGNTDTRHYLRFTHNVYRFSPTFMLPGDEKRFHGRNERISKKNYEQVIYFYYNVMRNADEPFSPTVPHHGGEL